MSATINPPSNAVTEWLKVFHAQGTENYTSSVTFMKQLTMVAVSIITYMKNAFTEDSYTVETFAGLKLKILKSKSKDEIAQFLTSALAQAFEALDKKYLQQLALCFYVDNCELEENLIEYHIFEYSYSDAGVSVNIHSKNRDSQKRTVKCTFEDVRQRTTMLVRTCIVMMQSCQQELPPAADISLRLYYNDDAPEGYQAPGFRAEGAADHLAATAADTLALGWVETPYHKMIARSYMRDTISDSHEVNPSENPPVMSLSNEEELNDSAQQPAPPLRCPCNRRDVDLGPAPPPLITCDHCGTRQHAACFGLSAAAAARLAAHCCAACADADRARRATDARLAGLSARKRECLCIFRLTLWWCERAAGAGGAELAARLRVSPANAAKLMRLLDSYGIVRLAPDADLESPQPIHGEPLRVQIGKYFQTEEEDLGDRLLAETFASQGSGEGPSQGPRDPVGEVLSPLEQVSLQAAASLGRVVDNPGFTPECDDPTLRQYREAVLSNEEMPLEAPAEGQRRKRRADCEAAFDHKRLRSGVKNKKIRG